MDAPLRRLALQAVLLLALALALTACGSAPGERRAEAERAPAPLVPRAVPGEPRVPPDFASPTPSLLIDPAAFDRSQGDRDVAEVGPPASEVEAILRDAASAVSAEKVDIALDRRGEREALVELAVQEPGIEEDRGTDPRIAAFGVGSDQPPAHLWTGDEPDVLDTAEPTR